MGAYNAVYDVVSRPAISAVDEILSDSRNFATAVHNGAGTFIVLMAQVFSLSLSILGALVKVSFVMLFYAFIASLGHEITFHTTNFFFFILSAALTLSGILPILGGIILGIVAFDDAVMNRRAVSGRRSRNPDWCLYLGEDILFFLVVMCLNGMRVTLYSPLLASVQSLFK